VVRSALSEDVFSLCRPVVVSTPAIDEVVYNDERRILIGGPGYHMSWIAKAYGMTNLRITGYVNERDISVFTRAIRERGGDPLLFPSEKPTARLLLDYTGPRRKVEFIEEPPDIDASLADRIKELSPVLLVISPLKGEIPIEILRELSSNAQWSVLDLQGYLRQSNPGEVLSVMPKRIVDVIHLSNDDIPERTFDNYIDDVSLLSRHTVLYTLGEKGAVLLDSNGNPRLRARPSETTETPSRGCGDVFTLSYSLFLCATWDPRKAFIEALVTSMYYAVKPPLSHTYIAEGGQ
jgi:hypothetical protein